MSALPDLDRKQRVRDLFFTKNEYFLDDRFVLRDGKKHPFAVICPGGGYMMVCSYIEGVPFAKRLNELGISAFILYYRVKRKALYPAPQDDLARAVREILAKAEEYKVEPEGYSVWGSSAGGHLAASFGTKSTGYANYGLPRPGAMVLCYPVISMRAETAHLYSREKLLGKQPDPALEGLLSVDEQVGSDYPPTFIWCGDADKTVKPENTRHMAAALEKAGVPHLCEIVLGVDHGVGPGTGTAAAGWIDRAAAFWLAQRKGETV